MITWFQRDMHHTHTLLDPSHPIALLAWLSASIKDLVPGLAAALAAENPKSEFAMLNSTCSTCSTAQGLLEYFFDLLGWPNSTTVPFVSLSSRLCLHLRSKTNKTNAGAHKQSPRTQDIHTHNCTAQLYSIDLIPVLEQSVAMMHSNMSNNE